MPRVTSRVHVVIALATCEVRSPDLRIPPYPRRVLFHIAPRAAWDEARRAGEYRPASLGSEGFIHLSTRSQWVHTARRYYRGVPDLVLLAIDPERLTAEVRFEEAHGEPFPHLYGALPVAAVTEVHALPVLEPELVALAQRLADPVEGPS